MLEYYIFEEALSQKESKIFSNFFITLPLWGIKVPDFIALKSHNQASNFSFTKETKHESASSRLLE